MVVNKFKMLCANLYEKITVVERLAEFGYTKIINPQDIDNPDMCVIGFCNDEIQLLYNHLFEYYYPSIELTYDEFIQIYCSGDVITEVDNITTESSYAVPVNKDELAELVKFIHEYADSDVLGIPTGMISVSTILNKINEIRYGEK